MWFTYACAALLMVPLALFIIVPYFTGDWHSSNVPRDVHRARGAASSSRSSTCSSSAWSAYGTEACATFAPEYKTHPGHAIGRSRLRGMFMLLVCVLLPLGLGGVDGVAAVATGAEGQFYTAAMGTLVGHGAASFFTICIIAQPAAVDDLVDLGRGPGAVRDLARRHDDQAVRRAQPLPRPRLAR